MVLFIGGIFFGVIIVLSIMAERAKRSGRSATTAGSDEDYSYISSPWDSGSQSSAVPGDRDGDGDVDAADRSDDNSSDSDDSDSDDSSDD